MNEYYTKKITEAEIEVRLQISRLCSSLLADINKEVDAKITAYYFIIESGQMAAFSEWKKRKEAEGFDSSQAHYLAVQELIKKAEEGNK